MILTGQKWGAILLAALFFFGAASAGLAETKDRMSFAGGEITISENDDYEKIVAFDGKELARDFVAFFDRIVELQGKKIALIGLAQGGNACGPYFLMVYKDGDGAIQTAQTENDCNTPQASVTGDALYFIPYVSVGEDLPLKKWTPDGGFKIAGNLSYLPQTGTGWDDLDPASMIHPLALFENEAFYNLASDILGGDLRDYATGLRTASKPDVKADGWVTADGCVPHACGIADSYLVFDIKNRNLYLAKLSDDGLRQWPSADKWPDEAKALLRGLRTP